jgi:hypothetical protein
MHSGYAAATMPPMTVLEDLEAFIIDHRSHGELTPEVGEPTPDGYLLEVACSCGTRIPQWWCSQ